MVLVQDTPVVEPVENGVDTSAIPVIRHPSPVVDVSSRVMEYLGERGEVVGLYSG